MIKISTLRVSVRAFISSLITPSFTAVGGVVLSALLLAACAGGGGRGGDPTPPPRSPDLTGIPAETSVNVSWKRPSLSPDEGIYAIEISWRLSPDLRRAAVDPDDEFQFKSGLLDLDNDDYLYYGENAAYTGVTRNDDKCPTYRSEMGIDQNNDTKREGLGEIASIGDLCDPANDKFSGRGVLGLENNLSFTPGAKELVIRWQNPAAAAFGEGESPEPPPAPFNVMAVVDDALNVTSLSWTNPARGSVASFAVNAYNTTANPEGVLIASLTDNLADAVSALDREAGALVSFNISHQALLNNSSYRLAVIANYAGDDGDSIIGTSVCIMRDAAGAVAVQGKCFQPPQPMPVDDTDSDDTAAAVTKIDSFTLWWKETTSDVWNSVIITSSTKSAPSFALSTDDASVFTSYALTAEEVGEMEFAGLNLTIALNATASGRVPVEIESQDNFVVVGPNFDGDALADAVDEDDDNDGILDTDETDLSAEGRDLTKESALKGSFLVPVFGDETALLYDDENPSYVVRGLATDSAYRFDGGCDGGELRRQATGCAALLRSGRERFWRYGYADEYSHHHGGGIP